MPSNVQLNSGAGGSIATTKQITHDGDTTQCQGVHLLGITGTEDAYTAGTIGGDATNGLDVDVTRIIPGTAATALGKAEDAAHASGDTGVAVLAVRQDTAAQLAGTDGDYSPLITDGSGRLHVNVGASALPTGASTAANQATANTALAAIQVAVETLDNAIAGTEMQVDVVAALPAGDNNIGNVDIVTVPAPLSTTGGGTEATALRVTIASDSTGVLSVDDNGGSITVDGAVDTELTTADLDTGAGTDTRAVVGLVLAASGGGVLVGAANPMPVSDNGGSITVDGAVTLGAELPAGTQNIGDVDVASVVPGTGATNLGKAEDAAHSSGDVGVMALTVRQNTAAALSGADGDYQPLITDTNGRLHVLDQNSAAALTSLQLIDNIVLVDDAAFTPATSSVVPAGFTADETTTDSVDEGDIGAARMTLDRKQIVTPYAHTAGGATPYQNLNVNAAISQVKGSAGNLYGIHVMNLTNPGAVVYLKFWNEASPDIGSDTPVFTFPVPHGQGSLGAGFVFPLPPCGVYFSAGIGMACTGASAPLDETSLSSSSIIVNLIYQ